MHREPRTHRIIVCIVPAKLSRTKPEPFTRYPKKIYHHEPESFEARTRSLTDPETSAFFTGVEFSTSRSSRLTASDRVSKQDSAHDADANSLSYVDMEYDFPKYATFADVTPLTPAERQLWVDLTPYMNQVSSERHAPYPAAYDNNVRGAVATCGI